MKVKKNLLFTFITIAVMKVNFLNAQMCGSSNLTINKLLTKAQLVVTGKVTDKHSFWNKQKSEIYTKYTIAVNQSSNLNTQKVYVIAEGGTVNDLTYKVFGMPDLKLQNEGVFFLRKAEKPMINNIKSNYFNLIDVALYNEVSNTIENGFSVITVDNFNSILRVKHKAIFSFTQKSKKNYKAKQAIITDVNPKSVAAGNNDVIVIDGNNFGSFAGNAKVSMRSAASFSPSAFFDIKAANVISWTDTKIEFIVPGDELTDNLSGVASGKIQVTNASGSTTTSSQSVEVKYNKKVYDGTSIAMRSKNNDGTIAVYVERQLIDDGALPAVENSLKKWNCATNSNLVYSGIVDGVCETYDGLTVICYDNSLQNPRLGRTRVISRNCTSTGFADLLDADITINPNINWAFTDSINFSQYHFESVLLHELGHAFTLGHVLNSADIMYPIINNSVIKTELTNNDIAGGIDVMSASFVENDCSSFGAIMPHNNAEACNDCLDMPEMTMKNLTKNSVFLSWEQTPGSSSYQIEYRYNGMDWNSYTSNTNHVILFDLQPCTNVEWRLMSSCDNTVMAQSEAAFRFSTSGCQ